MDYRECILRVHSFPKYFSLPVSDMNLTDREIMELAWETYYKRGELPPAIREILERIEKEDEKNPE